MVEYAIITANNFFSGFGPVLSRVQGLYRQMGLELTRQETLTISGVILGGLILGVIWMAIKR